MILLGIVALILLFFKLPGVPELFGIVNCTSCSTSTPYVPMLAAGYFAAFLTCRLCFPSLPKPPLKIGGLVWSLGLATVLTYLSASWCWICLIAHTCHILMWLFWKPTQEKSETLVGMKISIISTTSVAMMALYSTLNFTFLVYGLQIKSPIHSVVKEGTVVKPFEFETIEKQVFSSENLAAHSGVILNFVSPHCLFCKEQIPKLNEIAKEFLDKGFRFINVSRQVVPDLQALGPHLEWAEDLRGELSPEFGITGYPTLILLDSKGEVVKTAEGLSSDFETKLKHQFFRLIGATHPL